MLGYLLFLLPDPFCLMLGVIFLRSFFNDWGVALYHRGRDTSTTVRETQLPDEVNAVWMFWQTKKEKHCLRERGNLASSPPRYGIYQQETEAMIRGEQSPGGGNNTPRVEQYVPRGKVRWNALRETLKCGCERVFGI